MALSWLLAHAARAMVELAGPQPPSAAPTPGDSTVVGNTGAAHWRIPVDVPEGPGGFTPEVAITYSSHGGEGAFGVGWEVATGQIACSTRFGVPPYVRTGNAPCPRYELDGELLSYDAVARRYHTFVESFQHIVHVTAGGADYWESTTPKGVTRRYGTGPGSRITGPGGLTTRWLLAEVENPHGQKILYRYDGDPGDPDEDVPRNGFTYLSRILYGPGLTGPERELRFEYEARPDPVHDFRGGVERRISHRARAIEVLSHGLVHSRIRLGWDLGEIGETPTAGHYATARSRLSWVQRAGADGSTLPPVELRYTDSAGPELEWDQEAFDAPPLDFDTAWSWWPHAYLNPVDTGDLDGDGRVDLVMADQYGVGLQDVHLNTGSGFASFDPSWGAALAALGFAAPRADIELAPGAAYAVCNATFSEVPSRVFIGDSTWSLAVNAQFPTGEPGSWKPHPSPYVQLGGNFHLVDLDGDGRSDLVMSMRLAGIYRTHDCATGEPLPVPERIEPAGRTVRVAFRNTGGGWVEDPALAEGLPPFAVVMADGQWAMTEIWGTGTCDGFIDAGFWNYQLNVSYPVFPCIALIDLAPRFVDLNGDGRPDLVVAQPAFEHPIVDNTANGFYSDTQDQPRTTSQAWIQRPEGGWVRDPSYDLPFHHAHFTFYTGSGNVPWASAGDAGVRLADRNRDGYADVTWVNPYLDAGQWTCDSGSGYCPGEAPPGYASTARGVLLNRGAGDGSPFSAWCSSRPLAAEGGAVETCSTESGATRLEPPESERFAMFAVTAHATHSAGTELADLNGDGWLDLVRSKYPDFGGEVFGPPASFLYSPAGPEAWREDPRFEPPAYLGSYYHARWSGWLPTESRLLDLDGDGDADFSRGNWSQGEAASWLGRSGQPDLLREVRNGRGGVVRISYRAGPEQRDAALEADALAHAEELGEPPAGGDVVRWTPAPLVVAVAVEGPNREPAEVRYRYGHPRFCLQHRSQLGFGAIEKTLPDGSRLDSAFYQSHGRAGKLSRRLVSGPAGPLQSLHERWERPDPAGVAGAFAGDGVSEGSFLGRLAERTWWLEAGSAFGEVTGAVHRESLAYDDDYGFHFVARIDVERPSGDAAHHRLPAPVTERGVAGLVRRRFASAGAETWDDVAFEYTPEGMTSRQTRTRRRHDDGVVLEEQDVTRFRYDRYGNPLERIDPNGHVTGFCYDGNVERLDWCESPSGQSSGSVLVGRLDPGVGSEPGARTLAVPDPAFGIPVSLHSDYRDLPATRSVLDAFGRVVERWVTPTDGSAERLLETTHHDDHAAPPRTERLEHADPGGNAVRTVTVDDGFGGVWKEVRDADVPGTGKFLGNATYHRPGVSERRETYDIACADALCAGLTGEDESPARLVRSDALGRIVSVTTPDGTTLRHHGAAAEEIVLAPGLVGTRRVDVVLEQNARGDLVRRSFDGERLLALEECTNSDPDREGLEGESCADGLGLPIRTLYGHHPGGRLEVVYDPIAVEASQWSDPRHRLRFHHDSAGNVTRIDDPNAGLLLAWYDGAGNLTATENARGQVRSVHYDELDRITGIATPPGDPGHSLHYRPGELQLGSESTSGNTRTIEYDGLGRPAVERVRDGALRLWSRTERDGLGRLVYVNHPSSNTLYRYEGAFLASICTGDPQAGCYHGGIDLVGGVDYDALGRRRAIHVPGGTRRFEYAPDDRRHLVSDRFEGPAGSIELGYGARDGLGNVLLWSTTGSLGGLEASGTTQYDHRNRLHSWERNGQTWHYGYDALGNLTTRAGASGESNQVFAHASKPHAITSRIGAGAALYEYDLSGNRIESARSDGGSRHARYDSANRLVCVSSTAQGGCDVLRITYDARGRRIREETPALTRYFLGDFVHTRWTSGAFERRSEIRAFGERIATVTTHVPAALTTVAPPLLAALAAGGWLAAIALRARARPGSGARRRRRGAKAALGCAALALALSLPVALLGGCDPVSIHYRWVLSDPIGSGIALLDEGGRLVRHTRFLPFGGIDDEVRYGDPGARRFFAGHPRQQETGLAYMEARWMDPETGTFLSVDPRIARAGPQVDPPAPSPLAVLAGRLAQPEETGAPEGASGARPPTLEPHELNAYAYAYGNPLGVVDPDGEAGVYIGFTSRGGAGWGASKARALSVDSTGSVDWIQSVGVGGHGGVTIAGSISLGILMPGVVNGDLAGSGSETGGSLGTGPSVGFDVLTSGGEVAATELGLGLSVGLTPAEVHGTVTDTQVRNVISVEEIYDVIRGIGRLITEPPQ